MSKNTSKARQAARRTRRWRNRRAGNAAPLRGLFSWLLPVTLFNAIKLHGNTKWSPCVLTIQTLCWVWSADRCLTDNFTEAVQWTKILCGDAALTTYTGFMGALGTWSPTLLATLGKAIHARLEGLGSRHWQVGPWVLIAFDGSRLSTPRTKKNENAFCAANHGHGKTAQYRRKKTKNMRRTNNQKNKPQPPKPQVWLTMLWHVGMRLTWAWRRGPSNSSERQHVMDMVAKESFPKNTLFCGDAGFIGYFLWSLIIDRNCDFLVRVGANVHLLNAASGGRKNDREVLSWPQEAQKKELRPLRLRLLRVRINKKTRVWLLTSVLDTEKMTPVLAAKIYRGRVGELKSSSVASSKR